LYNLKNDISEKYDLSKKEPEMAASLLKKMKNWVDAVDAPIPNVLNN